MDIVPIVPAPFLSDLTHAPSQFGDQVDYPFGKRQRFRDWGLWLVDNDDELVRSCFVRYVWQYDASECSCKSAYYENATNIHVMRLRCLAG